MSSVHVVIYTRYPPCFWPPFLRLVRQLAVKDIENRAFACESCCMSDFWGALLGFFLDEENSYSDEQINMLNGATYD